MSTCERIGIGLAGFGTVGSGVWKSLQSHGDLISARTGGLEFEIRSIAVRDLDKRRDGDAPRELFHTDPQAVVTDPAVDIVVELIGGTDVAFDLVAAALRAGKPVVTGNKALLAERGKDLFELSREHKTPIHFEAAVAGGIPIIKAIQESLIANRLENLHGIINGTSNYILMRMTESGLDYPSALKEAKDLGYAEADESLDVNGWDAAHKAILLSTLAYGFLIDPNEVYVRGIEKVLPIDIQFATQFGYTLKLLSVVRDHHDGSIEVRTQPSFIPQSHILTSVHGVFNAVAINGDSVGDALFYGRGAGQFPTASSVMADLVEAGRLLSHGSVHRGFLPYGEGSVLPIADTVTRYYVRLSHRGEAGEVARIAHLLSEAGIHIEETHPGDAKETGAFTMIFLLDAAPFGNLCAALQSVEAEEVLTERPTVFRIESL